MKFEVKFEVNKFLALTAALATAAAAAAGCSSTDKKAVQDAGGMANDAGSGGAADDGKAGESAGGVTNAAGTAGAAGSNEGGAAGFGEGGAAGSPGEACIADLVGAGGAADEAGPCDVWYAPDAPDCGNEIVLAGEVCYDLASVARPAVVARFNACATALDSCVAKNVYACAQNLVDKGCAQDTTAVACTQIASTCKDTPLSDCAAVLDLASPDGVSIIEDCMDPAGESYDALYEGNCDQRLIHCAKLETPPPVTQLPPSL